MNSIMQDVKYALRMLAKNPGFTIVAVLTLGLGIGANTAIFSVVQNVLLRPLPYQNPDRLIEVANTYTSLPAWSKLGISPGDFDDWRQHARELSGMGAQVDIPVGFNMTGEEEPGRYQASYATANLFPILGIRPVVGRAFVPEEDKPGSSPVVMLTSQFWHSRFGGDNAVVGRTITLDGKGYSVIGVLPPSLQLARWADLWMPIGQYPEDLTTRIHHPFSVIARLKPGVTLEQAQAELVSLNHDAEARFPDTHKNWSVVARLLEDASATKMRKALLVLLAAVGLVLLIACVNIVNLLLVRNAARQKEIAVRIALGASRGRLVGQLLTESVLLALVGGGLGVLLAGLGLSGLQKLIPADMAVAAESRLNAPVLGFAIAVCLIAGIVCGLAPALQTLKTDLHGVLKEGGRAPGASSGGKLRNMLVISEMALALIPLVGAGLLLRSLHQLLEVNPGFRTDHVLIMEVNQPALSFDELNRLTLVQQAELTRKQSIQFEQIAQGIGDLPGVKGVGGIDFLPLGSQLVAAGRFLLEGQTVPPGGARPAAEVRTVSLGYFSAAGIPLLRGRSFNENDWGLTNVVINQTMAQNYWPGKDPIGQRINFCTFAPQPCYYPIVGMVADVHQFGLDAPPTSDVYLTGGWVPRIVIHTTSNPAALAGAVIEEVHRVDPNLPVTHVMTMDGLLSESVSPRRFSAVLLGIFAALALLLAAVGIYGVMSYVVSRQTSEIGIRMALGAKPHDIMSLIVGRGARLAFAGLAIGLAGSFALTRLLSSLLFDVKATDPSTFAGVSLLLMTVAVAACYIPARRAMRISPNVALRYE